MSANPPLTPTERQLFRRLDRLEAKLDQVLAALRTKPAEQPTHVAGARRSADGNLFLPGTGTLTAGERAYPDTTPHPADES